LALPQVSCYYRPRHWRQPTPAVRASLARRAGRITPLWNLTVLAHPVLPMPKASMPAVMARHPNSTQIARMPYRSMTWRVTSYLINNKQMFENPDHLGIFFDLQPWRKSDYTIINLPRPRLRCLVRNTLKQRSAKDTAVLCGKKQPRPFTKTWRDNINTRMQ